MKVRAEENNIQIKENILICVVAEVQVGMGQGGQCLPYSALFQGNVFFPGCHTTSTRLQVPNEVEHNFCLFERLFKVKKNGFGISFSILEIFMFLYYANEESDDVIGGFTKTVQHSIKSI